MLCSLFTLCSTLHFMRLIFGSCFKFLSVSVSASLATEEEFEKRNQSKAVYLGGLGKLIIFSVAKGK